MVVDIFSGDDDGGGRLRRVCLFVWCVSVCDERENAQGKLTGLGEVTDDNMSEGGGKRWTWSVR